MTFVPDDITATKEKPPTPVDHEVGNVIGPGVLSLPSVLNTLGLIPGVIILCVIAGITTWSNYMVGVFKRTHPDVYGVDDVGQLLFGRIGKELFAAAFMGRMPPTCLDF